MRGLADGLVDPHRDVPVEQRGELLPFGHG
jgi:hypothetical protein